MIDSPNCHFLLLSHNCQSCKMYQLRRSPEYQQAVQLRENETGEMAGGIKPGNHSNKSLTSSEISSTSSAAFWYKLDNSSTMSL